MYRHSLHDNFAGYENIRAFFGVLRVESINVVA